MSGSTNLDYLLREANPVLDAEDYVFLCCDAEYGDHAEWQPIASLREDEGLTLVVRKAVADANEQSYEGTYKRITLQVHSSLDAVGLTASFATRLTEHNISANVIAGFYHDHIFVASGDAQLAMSALATLAER